MTLHEIRKHPERMTEEDRKSLLELYATIQEVGKATAAYNIKIDKQITSKMIASEFYQEHLITAAVLEAFFDQDEISYLDLNKGISNHVPNDFLYDLPITYIQNIIAKTIRLGYIQPIDTGDKYMPHFRITEEGVNALKNQTFQSLAAASFFGKQTFELNRQTKNINTKMLLLTILMTIMTAISIIMSMCR